MISLTSLPPLPKRGGGTLEYIPAFYLSHLLLKYFIILRVLKKNKFISNLSSPFREAEGLIKHWRWQFCCLFVFVDACNSKPVYNKLILTHRDSVNILSKNKRAFASIEDTKSIIVQGDLILRTGNDFTSESLRKLSSVDKTYSHCGIASIENDTVFVYHALGGEWNPDEKLRRDPLELFCNPIENRGFGIFTFNFNPRQKYCLDSVVKSWYKKGLMFDMDFDLKTNDRMYCAEFVGKAINTATNKQINFSATKINTFEFIAVDNLFLNKNCVEKKRIRFL